MIVAKRIIPLLLAFAGLFAGTKPPPTFRGAVVSRDGAAVLTWGDGLWSWPARSKAEPTLLEKGQFGEGGCLVDVNQDGQPDLVLEELPAAGSLSPLGTLIWLEAPTWRRHVLDTGIEMPDCLGTSLLGKSGILMVQRHAQVRFYTVPPSEALPSAYQEVYSFYTPSRQAGLLLADIDQDGHQDILCGNYWIQSPESFQLPWHLFAIELYNDTEFSATLRLALFPGADRHRLVAAQRDMADARAALFTVEPGADSKTLWTEHRLEVPGGFHFPRGLLMSSAPNRNFLLTIAEDNGKASRLFLFAVDSSGWNSRLIRSQAINPVLDILTAGDSVFLIHAHAIETLRKTQFFYQ